MAIKLGQVYRLFNFKTPVSCLYLNGDDEKLVVGYPASHGGVDGDSDRERQKWRIEEAGSGWTFKCIGTGRYLGYEGKAEDGVQLVVCARAFKWNIEPDKQYPEVFRISVPDTNFDIDLGNDGSADPRTPIQLLNRQEPGLSQLWTITLMQSIRSGGTYKLVNRQSGNCITLSGEDRKSIIECGYLDSGDQHWFLDDTGTGWTIKSVVNEHYIGVEGAIGNGKHLSAGPQPFNWDIRLDGRSLIVYRAFVPDTILNMEVDENASLGSLNPICISDQKVPGRNQTWTLENV